MNEWATGETGRIMFHHVTTPKQKTALMNWREMDLSLFLAEHVPLKSYLRRIGVTLNVGLKGESPSTVGSMVNEWIRGNTMLKLLIMPINHISHMFLWLHCFGLCLHNTCFELPVLVIHLHTVHIYHTCQPELRTHVSLSAFCFPLWSALSVVSPIHTRFWPKM